MSETASPGAGSRALQRAVTSQRLNGTPMPLTLVLTVTVVVLGVIVIAALAVLADRSSRATAWRQIALERRWNHEQHR